jgi:hypothetical protein
MADLDAKLHIGESRDSGIRLFNARPGNMLQQSLTLFCIRAIVGTPQFHIFVRPDPSLCPISFEACGVTWTKRATQSQKEGPDMRVHPVALSLAIATVGGIAVPNPAFSEEYRGTFEQQLACTPDVFRLCGEHIPDATRIVACLRQNASQLSGPCRSVFESNASAPPEGTPRRRNDQLRSYSGQ